MKAAIWYEKGDIRIETRDLPVALPGKVRLKIKACGICGSDIHEYKAGPFIIPRKPHPLTGKAGGPVILGHEFSAEVEALGEGVKGFQAGDRVAVNPLLYCGKCHYCQRGEKLMCVKLGTVGFAEDGAFAEYAVVPEYALHKMPDSMSDDEGAFIEPLAVAVRAVNRSRLRLGQTAVVIGAGPIGLLVMQVCQAVGASEVFVVEPMAGRRELAEKLGATHVIDPYEQDPGKTVGEMTNRMRADVAIDCVGIQASFDTAVKVTGRRGVICVAGLSLKPIEAPFLRLWSHEKEIVFTQGYETEFPTAISLLANKRVKTEEMVTRRIGLDGLVKEGIEELMGNPGEQVKILVYPDKR